MKRPKKLLYQPNRLAYSTMLLYILCSGIYLVFTLKSMTVNQSIAFVSLVNIVAILYAFLVSVKLKVYDRKHQFTPFLFAGLMLFQVLNIPAGVLENDLLTARLAGFAAMIFAVCSGIVAIVKTAARRRYILANNVKDTHLAK